MDLKLELQFSDASTLIAVKVTKKKICWRFVSINLKGCWREWKQRMEHGALHQLTPHCKKCFWHRQKSAVGYLVFMNLKLCFLTSSDFAPHQQCFLQYKPKPARPCFLAVNIAVQKCDLWKSEIYKLSALGFFLFVEVKMFFDLPTYFTQDEDETSYPVCHR